MTHIETRVGVLNAVGPQPAHSSIREPAEPAPEAVEASSGDRVFDLNGRWVWRGRGGHSAHLIRERSAASSTPWTLCGRRLRQPRRAWRGVCPTCLSRATNLDAEATPARERTMTTPNPRSVQ